MNNIETLLAEKNICGLPGMKVKKMPSVYKQLAGNGDLHLYPVKLNALNSDSEIVQV